MLLMQPQNPQPSNPYQPQQPPGLSPQPTASEPQPQVVYITRPLEPEKPEITPEIRQKHEDSKRRYPSLNLSEGEYIISAVKRHPVGLLWIWGFAGIIVALILGLMVLYSGNFGSSLGLSISVSPAVMAIPAFLLCALIGVGALIATWIYRGNEFYLTNESVVQRIQAGLFNKREQTVSLSNIEDASYTQAGILPHILNYGLIRLSTEGDETTYRFSFASDPKKQVAILNNAVEAFKMGRPVSADENFPNNS